MVTYFLNQMGPWYTEWYIQNGIPCKKVTRYNRIAGQELTTMEPEYYVAAGRIDIRDSSKQGYDGWGEYSVPPMKQLSWNLFGDWLDKLDTETVLEYNELILRFEKETGHKIEWIKEKRYE